MTTSPQKIFVIFKTHLDVGFTDFSEKVVDNYMQNYLPNAMRVAKEMGGKKEGFIWTVGSWLIEKYLEEGSDKKLLEEAIRRGEVRWHGLPFTTHTELMDENLLKYGLDISKKLDKKFGMKTIAAKFTDVPGHTKAMIPHLYHAGIRFLHIGVNPASSMPVVPDLFRWRADSGEELVVMYNSDYGKMTMIGNSKTAVYFAHTGDNRGPQSAEAITEIYRELHKNYPQAELQAATLEDIAEVALRQENLPVITDEIGDTWIHGVGTDPRKVSTFRALLGLKNLLSEKDMKKMYKYLIMVPEHTWGMDEKVNLGTFLIDEKGEHRYFVRTEFEAVRSTEKFQNMERSWQEQRNYVTAAVEALSGKARTIAKGALCQYTRKPVDVTGWHEVQVMERIVFDGYELQINENGAICSLKNGEQILADESHLMGQFVYQVLSQNEYDRWRDQYVISKEAWAIEDFGKIGVDKAIDCQKDYLPHTERIYQKGHQIVISMTLPQEATVLYGGMERLEMLVELSEKEIVFDFAWFDKHASRVPESSWIQFASLDNISKLKKIGVWIDPAKVIKNGNRHMHAVEAVQMEKMTLLPVDSPVVALGRPWIMEFTNEQPDLFHGIWANLHNNTWGTNFPMWYEDDARFRYVFKLQT